MRVEIKIRMYGDDFAHIEITGHPTNIKLTVIDIITALEKFSDAEKRVRPDQ